MRPPCKFLSFSVGILLLSVSVSTLRVAYVLTKNPADEAFAIYTKAYEHGKEVGYQEGVQAACETFLKNPNLLAPSPNITPPTSKMQDKVLVAPSEPKA